MCERSKDEPEYPKYPRLPVLECAGHEPLPSAGSGPQQQQ